VDLSCKSINLFPTYFWKLKVPNHQIIKDKYLQSFIDGYDNSIYRVPKGWVTHKCHTSFEETKLADKDICDEYSSVFNTILKKNGLLILNYGIKCIKIMSIKSGMIICQLHCPLYIF
jgi:hypothetical protein